MESKRKKILLKKDRYQEMYANDLLSLSELKEKVEKLLNELKTIDGNLEQLEQATKQLSRSRTDVPRYTEEINRFLALETITNTDLRKIVDHISVNRDGNVRIVLKKIEKLPGEIE